MVVLVGTVVTPEEIVCVVLAVESVEDITVVRAVAVLVATAPVVTALVVIDVWLTGTAS